MPQNTKNHKIVEKELSYKLGGIFFVLQKRLGRFCRERQYADALETELRKNNLEFEREHPIVIENRKSNFVDFIIENRILVDLKTKPYIEKSDYYQMKRYLEAAELELGLIVNFSQRYLNPKRVLNSRARKFSEHSDKFVVSDRDLNSRPRKFSEHSDKFVVSDRARGYTLVELLVAIAVFTIVTSIAVGGFVKALRTQRQATALMAINSNISAVLEQISREYRTRTGPAPTTSDVDTSGANCPNNVQCVLKFTNANGDSVIYEFFHDAAAEIKGIQKNGNAITDDNVSVQYLIFSLQNPTNYPPRVTILLGITSKEQGISGSVINLQTTISSRNP